jgi:hypothetical protein
MARHDRRSAHRQLFEATDAYRGLAAGPPMNQGKLVRDSANCQSARVRFLTEVEAQRRAEQSGLGR